MKRFCLSLLVVLSLLNASLLQAQVVVIFPPTPPRPTPPIRPTPTNSDYRVRSVDVQTTIRDQSAQVQISQIFQNTGSTTLEAQLIFPVPENAAVSGLTLLVDGKELAGKLMKKDEARRIYEEIVRRRQDPALLEYMGQGVYQTSVFPIPPQAERTVQIRYSQLLRKDQGLVDLLLPIGNSKHSTKVVDALDITIRVESTEPIKTIYSPSHALEIKRPDDKHATCALNLKNVSSPNDLRLLYGTTAGMVGTNVLSYKPLDGEDGYFVLLASPEVKTDAAQKTEKSMIFVFDRSGSMSGKKIEQAKEALKFLVNQLKPTDTFNIVAYDSAVESFRPELQRADEATTKSALSFVDGLYAGGSTNISGALQTALKMLTDPKRPSYVLFLTDGLPTVGEMDELKIAANAKQENAVNARLFTFGVGFDVNSRLLDRLSRDGRGQSVYVRPNENIEAHISSLYNKIGSPLLTDLAVTIDFDKPQPADSAAPISRTYPRQLTDLFQGEQLVWVGRYKQGGLAKVTLTGTVGGEKKSFSFPASFAEKSGDESNGFVEKLWATRRIGEIIDELDLKGKNQELVDELVQLSIKHGIITPYTSFLAEEQTNLADRTANARRAGDHASRELARAEGREGFMQRQRKGELQNAAQADGLIRRSFAGKPSGATKGATSEPRDARSNRGALPAAGPAPTAGAAALPGVAGQAEADESAPEAEVEMVRNIGQKTFFRKNKQWQDSSVTPEQQKQAIRVKQFSKEYFDLAAAHGGTLAKYLAFDEPVVVNLDGKTYQIDPPDRE